MSVHRGNIYRSFGPLSVYCKFAGAMALRHTPSGFQFSWLSPEAVWPFIVTLIPIFADLYYHQDSYIKLTKFLVHIVALLIGTFMVWANVRSTKSIILLLEELQELDVRLLSIGRTTEASGGLIWLAVSLLASLPVLVIHGFIPVSERPQWLTFIYGIKFLSPLVHCLSFNFLLEQTRARVLLLRVAWAAALRSLSRPGSSTGVSEYVFMGVDFPLSFGAGKTHVRKASGPNESQKTRLEGVRSAQALLGGLLERLGLAFARPFFWSQMAVLLFVLSTLRRTLEELDELNYFLYARLPVLSTLIASFVSAYFFSERLTRSCKEFFRGSFGISVSDLDPECQFQIIYFQHQMLLTKNEIDCYGLFNLNMFVMGSISTVIITYSIAVAELGSTIGEVMNSLNAQHSFTLKTIFL